MLKMFLGSVPHGRDNQIGPIAAAVSQYDLRVATIIDCRTIKSLGRGLRKTARQVPGSARSSAILQSQSKNTLKSNKSAIRHA